MVFESFQIFREKLMDCTLELLGPILGQWIVK